jgi:hypothetical protein
MEQRRYGFPILGIGYRYMSGQIHVMVVLALVEKILQCRLDRRLGQPHS